MSTGSGAGPRAEAGRTWPAPGEGPATRPGGGSHAPQARTKPRRVHASPRQRGVRSRPDWPGSARAGPAGSARPRRRAAGLNLAGPMGAVGRWGAAWPPLDSRLLAGSGARSRPPSGPFSALLADARARGPGPAAASSPSPPPSCSGSTASLLSPLRHQSFPFDDDDGDGEDEEEVDEDAHHSEAKGASLGGTELRGCDR